MKTGLAPLQRKLIGLYSKLAFVIQSANIDIASRYKEGNTDHGNHDDDNGTDLESPRSFCSERWEGNVCGCGCGFKERDRQSERTRGREGRET